MALSRSVSFPLAAGAVVIALCAAPALSASRGSTASAPAAKSTQRPRSFFDLSAPSIDRANTTFGRWRGKVVLVVNTASQCGNTPQYAGLQQLWEKYRQRGLVVLGFPSNDFDHQEPASEPEIKKFCTVNYAVTFPLFSKVVTRGEGQSPVYRFLTAKHGEPEWNFHKYLVGRDGQVVRAFRPTVLPDDPELRAAIDAALAP